jgi:hypothetical protein
MMHINDLLLEPVKKVFFKLKLAKKKKWFYGNDISLTPGADAYETFTEKINAGSPLMIARFGSTEMTCIVAYILSHSKKSYLKKSFDFITGETPAFWFGYKNRTEICNNSGFFPDDKELVSRFSQTILEYAKDIDVLLTWLNGEKYIFPFLKKNCIILSLWDIEPFFQEKPWTMHLEGKKVLVIHPYAKSITSQYPKRHQIFPDKQVLPDMELKTYRSVQSIANNKIPFKDWFEALHFMNSEIEKIDFDIALIGAGAYGMPMAAHIKRMGKQAIHIGGSLQLYFGIIGARWEKIPHFKAILNEHWVRPLPEEHPDDFKKVEGGVYW